MSYIPLINLILNQCGIIILMIRVLVNHACLHANVDNRRQLVMHVRETWSGSYSSAKSRWDQIELFLVVEFVNNG